MGAAVLWSNAWWGLVTVYGQMPGDQVFFGEMPGGVLGMVIVGIEHTPWAGFIKYSVNVGASKPVLPLNDYLPY